MVWSIDMDDFTGTFCNQGKYPLISTLKSTLGIHSNGELFLYVVTKYKENTVYPTIANSEIH